MNGNLHRIRREAGFRTAEEFARCFALDEGRYAKLERETDGLPTGRAWGDHMDIRTVNALAELYRVPTAAVLGAVALTDDAVSAAAESAKHALRVVEKAAKAAPVVNEQVARHVDVKGNVVLGRFSGGSAVVFRGGVTAPFGAVTGYDEKTGNWSDVTWCDTAAEAWDHADPNVLDEWETVWTREDIAESLDGRGYFPTDDSIDKIIDEIKTRGGLSGVLADDGWDVISEAIVAPEEVGEFVDTDRLGELAERETALPAEEAPVHDKDKDGEEL